MSDDDIRIDPHELKCGLCGTRFDSDLGGIIAPDLGEFYCDEHCLHRDRNIRQVEVYEDERERH